MRDIESYLRWCSAQSKGIRMAAPSDNLSRAYLEKAASALKSMEVNAEAGIDEWAVSAAYYARYFAVYALLSKLGIKCEIHDCTISLFEFLFSGSVRKELIDDIKLAKADRVENQYYPRQQKVDLDAVAARTKEFVLAVEELLDGLNRQRIEELRRRLDAALSG